MKDHLTLTFDGGTSLTKIIYRLIRDGFPDIVKHLVMSPEVIQLAEELAQSHLDFGEEHQRAWIQLPPKKNQEFYAVGKLAKEQKAFASIRRLKHTLLLPKILAAIGAIAAREKISGKFSLDLFVLLPLGEYDSKSILESDLKQAINYFWYRGKPVRVNLNQYRCYPEGLGLALEIKRQLGDVYWKSKTIGIIVFGYRNLSWLLYESGNLAHERSKTTTYGFYDLLDRIARKLSGISREEIQAAIVTKSEEYVDVAAQCKKTRLITTIEIERLLRETNPRAKALEEKKIKAAINKASSEHWQLISDFFYEVNAALVENIYYCGGTGVFFERQLRTLFQDSNVTLASANSLRKSPKQSLREALALTPWELQQFIAQNLEVRFNDPWNLFDNLTEYSQEIAAKQLQSV